MLLHKTYFLFCFIHLHTVHHIILHQQIWHYFPNLCTLFSCLFFKQESLSTAWNFSLRVRQCANFASRSLRPVLIHDLWLPHIPGTRNLIIISNSWSCYWFYVCSLKMIKNFVIKGTKSKHSTVLMINVDSTNGLFFDWIDRSIPTFFPSSLLFFFSLSFIEFVLHTASEPFKSKQQNCW